MCCWLPMNLCLLIDTCGNLGRPFRAAGDIVTPQKGRPTVSIKAMKMNEPDKQMTRIIGRRQFLSRSGMGMGSLALAGLLSDDGRAEDQPLTADRTHFEGPAQHVIHVFLNGECRRSTLSIQNRS